MSAGSRGATCTAFRADAADALKMPCTLPDCGVPGDERHGRNLTIKTHALAAKILFEGKRAVGVEYIDGAHVYRADPAAEELTPDPASLPRGRVYARREVIVSGGAFNTPQLLMLSGVGRPEELELLMIETVAESPGVGLNLHDHPINGLSWHSDREDTWFGAFND